MQLTNNNHQETRKDILTRYQRATTWFDTSERMNMQKERYKKLQRHYHWIMEYTDPERLPLDIFDLTQLNLHYKGFNQIWRALSPAIRRFERESGAA